MADQPRAGEGAVDRWWWLHNPSRAVRWLVTWLRGGTYEYEFDWDADASYLRVRRGKVAHTYTKVGNGEIFAVDVDRWWNVLGIEFLGVRRHMPTQVFNGSMSSAQTITTEWKPNG